MDPWTYLVIGLGAFFIVSLLQTLVVAPEWAWPGLLLVLALAGLGLCSDLTHWYGAFAISGIGQLILRAESLLLVKADESLATIKRRR